MQICDSLMKWKGVIALAFVFVINVSVAPPLSPRSHTSVWCLPASGGWLIVSCQDWPVDHACRLVGRRVGRRGQSQGATYTGGFQDFIVWALMPRPKRKNRGRTNAGDATYAGGFTKFRPTRGSKQLDKGPYCFGRGLTLTFKVKLKL